MENAPRAVADQAAKVEGAPSPALPAGHPPRNQPQEVVSFINCERLAYLLITHR